MIKARNLSNYTPSIEDLPESFVSMSASQSFKSTAATNTPSSTQEKSLITQHFFGKMKQFMTYTKDTEKV